MFWHRNSHSHHCHLALQKRQYMFACRCLPCNHLVVFDGNSPKPEKPVYSLLDFRMVAACWYWIRFFGYACAQTSTYLVSQIIGDSFCYPVYLNNESLLVITRSLTGKRPL